MGTLFHVECLICHASELKPLSRYSKISLVQCQSCGFLFSRAIPHDQDLLKLYDHYGRKDYLSPITVKRYNQILNRFEKFRKTNKLMDVGCGIGYFLEAAKQRGWEVYGSEITDEAVRICREKGINMQQGKLDTQQYLPGSFDVVTSFEVMEHINNPKEEGQKFYTLLRNGGIMYLTTPNFNSLSRLLLKDKWTVFSYPEHLCYYTSRTILRLFTDIGFIKERIEATGISITRLMKIMKSSGEKNISATSTDEKLRVGFERNRIFYFLKKTLNRVLILLSAGDNLKATFVKN